MIILVRYCYFAYSRPVFHPNFPCRPDERRGSISAEHGLGQMKNKYLPESKSPEVVALMKKVWNVVVVYAVAASR